MAEAGEGLEINFLQKHTDQTLTSTAPEDPWFSALTQGTIFSSTNTKKSERLSHLFVVEICQYLLSLLFVLLGTS